MNKILTVSQRTKYMKCFLRVLYLIIGFLWFLIMLNFILPEKSSDYSTLSLAYVPQLVRIPDSVYSLSKLLLKNNINLPSIPIEINDPNLFVLSVRANRLRSGGSAIFVLSKQKEILDLDLWCLFDNELITPVYIYHVKKSEDYILFLECSLPDSIIRRLWYNRTTDRETKIYLSTSTKLLLQGFLNIPWSKWAEENEQALTLCTLSSQTELIYFIEWIEFHRLVGISKFVIYNISNMSNEFHSIVNHYEEEYPGLIDIIPWNYSFAEIQYDCFLQYGDISEWITMIEINEYLIPQLPYDTLPRLLSKQYGRHLQASVILEYQEFCLDIPGQLTKTGIVIEEYISRCLVNSNHSIRYMYRPRAIDYLSIHRDNTETNSYDHIKSNIVLAHYPIIEYHETLSEFTKDTTIRDRFTKRLRDEIVLFNRKKPNE